VIGTSFLGNLACTLLPAVVWWIGDVRPTAPVTADCRCKVCECKGKCECKPAPPPAQAAPAVRYCPGQHGGRPLPPPPVPAAAGETVYQVQVKLAGDGGPVCFPAVRMPANTHSLLSVGCGEGRPAVAMHMQVKPVDEGTVRLRLELGAPGKPGKRLGCTSQVRLDTVTGVVLGGDGPEPCPAEVCVRAVKEEPQARPLPPPVCPSPYVVPPAPAGAPVPAPPCALPNVAATMPLPPLPAAPVMPPPIGMAPPAPETMPEPLPTPVIAPPPVAPAVRLVSASRPRPTAVSVMQAKGKAELCWKHADGSVSRCVRMKRESGESGVLTFAAGKKHVHVHGRTWTATADKV
jgi:hypothetical protein